MRFEAEWPERISRRPTRQGINQQNRQSVAGGSFSLEAIRNDRLYNAIWTNRMIPIKKSHSVSYDLRKNVATNLHIEILIVLHSATPELL